MSPASENVSIIFFLQWDLLLGQWNKITKLVEGQPRNMPEYIQCFWIAYIPNISSFKTDSMATNENSKSA